MQKDAVKVYNKDKNYTILARLYYISPSCEICCKPSQLGLHTVGATGSLVTN